MASYIQQLPVSGSGDIIYPDAAMDAGTACLVDLIDTWAWGGTIPSTGAALTGRSIRNYALEADGWDETPGIVSSSGLLGDGHGAVVFSSVAQYLMLPPGFCPPQGATKFGFILWMSSTRYDVTSSINNTIFSVATGTGVGSIGLFPNYSASSITNVIVNGLGFNAGAFPLVAPMLDGAMHQIALEFDVTVGGTSYLRIYVDGAQVGQFTSAIATAVQDTLTRAFIGRHPSYNGQGLKGKFVRAMMVLTNTVGARPFADTVARDYMLNADRLAY